MLLLHLSKKTEEPKGIKKNMVVKKHSNNITTKKYNGIQNEIYKIIHKYKEGK